MAPAPNPADLRAIFGMPPQAAIDYLRRKGYAITWNWHDVQAAAHARGFTVAKMTSLDMLRDVRQGLLDNFAAGATPEDFVKIMQPMLEARGWWGKRIVVDSEGGAEVVRLGTPRRLRTIYQTNAQSAYMGARYKAMMAAVATHPYWQYIAVMDASTRPSHAALNGKVFRATDPIWEFIFPPNDYNCRCRAAALTEHEVKARNLAVEDGAAHMQFVTVEMGVDKRTGEVRQTEVAQLDTTDAATGKPVKFRPAPGFSGSPAQSHLMDELLLDKARAALGDAAALREVQNVLLSDARMQAWQSFVDQHFRGFANGQPATDVMAGQSIAFGVMRPQDIAYAAGQGIDMHGVMAIKSELLGGGKAFRHTTQNRNALSVAEWLSLPRDVASPDMVLWDTRKKNFLYVFAAQDGRSTKVVVERGAGNGFEATDTVFKVPATNLDEGIAAGTYVPVP